jgi:small-conductance mechanosensitive channel
MTNVFTWISTNIAFILTVIIVTGLFYYIGGKIMGRIVKHTIETTRHRNWHPKDIEKRERTLVGLFKTIWRILVLTVAAFTLFSQFFPGANLGPLFASAGIVGVALGFGAQSLVKDFLSGIFIISENQYRVGDIIELEGASGTVERIGARSTVIRDADGNVHYFPNGMVQHVINKTMGYSVARFSIGIHPSSNIEAVIELINNIGKTLSKEEHWKSKILEAPAFVSVGEFTATNVNLLISGKTQPSDQWAVTAEMRRRLLEAFEDKGIYLSAATPELKKKK